MLRFTAKILLAAFLCGVAPAVRADDGNQEDYIRTTTGTEFRGRITEETGEKVTIRTQSGPVSIPRSVIAELRKAGVDYRPPSERVAAVEIPEGEEAKYLERARASLKEGKYEDTVGVCKGLMACKAGRLAADERDTVGKTVAQAYFELKDWKAAAGGLRYAARSIPADNEVDRKRVEAMAEALEKSEPPSIAGETAENFAQAMSLAMRWKADQIFDDVKTYVVDNKDLQLREVLERTLKTGKENLARSEPYVPGYSVEKWPEVCKTVVTVMLDTVQKATVECTEEREWLERYCWQKTVSVKYAVAWNDRCYPYLRLRNAAENCLENVGFIDETEPLKKACSDEEYKKLGEARTNLAKTLEDLKTYSANVKLPNGRELQTKGKTIQPTRIGNSR